MDPELLRCYPELKEEMTEYHHCPNNNCFVCTKMLMKLGSNTTTDQRIKWRIDYISSCKIINERGRYYYVTPEGDKIMPNVYKVFESNTPFLNTGCLPQFVLDDFDQRGYVALQFSREHLRCTMCHKKATQIPACEKNFKGNPQYNYIGNIKV